MKSARILALVVFALGFAFNEWAFRFIFPLQPIDSFMRLMTLAFDCFIFTFVVSFFWRNVPVSERIKLLLQKHSRSVSVFIGLFIAYSTFMAVEFSCRYFFKHFYQAGYTEQTHWEPSAIQRDSIMGSKLPADTVISHAYVVNDSLIYKQYYHIDQFGRRISPSTKSDSLYNEFAIITGCSFAFGYGLNEHETLGYFADSLIGMRAYNYAVSGYGTQQTLEVLKNHNLRSEIAEPNGVLIHLFIDDHIKRLIGSRRLIKLWASHFPYYYLDGDELKRDGSFWSGRHIQSRFYRAISESAFIGLFDIDVPWFVTDNHLALFATVLSEAKNEFLKQYPEGRFVVIIGPNSELASRVNNVLNEIDIEFLDCSNLLDKEKSEYKIHWTEGHPSAKYHLEIADSLKQYLHANPK